MSLYLALTIISIAMASLVGYAVHTIMDCARDAVATTDDVEQELNSMETVYRAPLHCRVNVVRAMPGPVTLLGGYASIEHELNATALWIPTRKGGYTKNGTLIM